ncbi:T9SS type A sorting domain-containing protein [Hymenobacter amundsenii]|uniref:T9SS type A sorting domain-containing protein n=1 Tax=Hymenobacter amundsenii TaxID=2006685 RepID=UPI0013FDA8CC|nr:T9SS type A sorting domain-containing protein [Hymenobacter amundsenii]
MLNSPAFAQSVPAGVAPVPIPAPTRTGTTGFAIDGDLIAYFPSIGASIFGAAGDWLPAADGKGGVLTASGGVPTTADPTRVFHSIDAYDKTDKNFAGGSKIDSNPNGVGWVTGGTTPSKDDINNVLVYISEATNGDIWAIMGADRKTKEGNSFIAFQFLQKTLTRNTTGNTAKVGFTSAGVNGGRTVGDIQVTAEFVNGGTTPNLYYEEWKQVGVNAYDWVSISNPPDGAAFGRTNGVTLTGLPYDAFNGTSYEPNLFAEVAVNITEVYKNVETTCVGKISTLWVVTKSSQSSSANMTDFVDPIQLDLKLNVTADAGLDKAICQGGSTQIGPEVDDGADYTYSWSPATGLSSTSVAQPTASPTTTTTYTVSVTKKGTSCTQTDAVKVTVNPNPLAPGVANKTVCATAGSSTTLAAQVTLSANASLVFTDVNGVVLTSQPTTQSTAIAGKFVYYVRQQLGECLSPVASFFIEVNATPDAPQVANVSYCQNEAAVALTATGTGLKWYTYNGTSYTLLGGAPTPSTSTVGTISYYVSQTTTGCEGPRAKIDVIVNALPAAPGVANVTYCQNEAAVALTATGTGLKWYTLSGSTYTLLEGGAPTPSTSTVGTISYYVSQTTTGCEGPRAKIDVIVNALPAAPQVQILRPDLCTTLTSSLALVVTNAENGVTYTLTQPNLSPPATPLEVKVPLTGTPEVIFRNLVAGGGYHVTATKGTCTSGEANCPAARTAGESVKAAQTSADQLSSLQTAVYPNPTGREATINFRVPSSGRVVIQVYNSLGMVVDTLYDGVAQAGENHSVVFNGSALPSGTYIYRVITSGKTLTNRISLSK